MSVVKTLPLDQALEQLKLPGLYDNLFSSPDWLKVLQRTYHLRLFVKYIERDGQIDSYIIYSVVHNFLEWKICVCSYCDYFDCYVKSVDDWHMFFRSLREEYPRYRMAIRNLRDRTVRECSAFQLLSKEYHHAIDLHPSVDELWKKLHQNFKGACKSAMNNGVEVRRCGKEELRDFYEMHLRLRKNKYRLFPQPYRFFSNIWDQYMTKGMGVLLGAYNKQNKIVAANVYLICGDTLYYKFSTSRLDSLLLRPNNLLIWEGIKFAKERDLKYLDLGSSGYYQNSLVWFKDHICQGTTKSEITHLGFAPSNYKFSRKIILNIMTELFTHPWIPNFMVRWGSSIIYPYLA